MSNLNTKTLINESVGLVCKGSSMVKRGASMYLDIILKYADKKLIDKFAKSKLTKDANAVIESGFDNMTDEVKNQTTMKIGNLIRVRNFLLRLLLVSS